MSTNITTEEKTYTIHVYIYENPSSLTNIISNNSK